MQKLISSPFFNVSLLAIFWALQIFITKLAFLAGVSLFTFTIQSAIVTSFFLLLYILPKAKKFKKLSPYVLFWLCAIGIITSGFGGILSNAGINLTTAINAGFLFQFDIAVTVIFAWIILKEKLDKTKIFMLFFILVGSFFLTTNGQFIIPHLGDIFIIIASACFALGTVLARKFLKNSYIDPDIASFLRPTASIPFLFLAVAASSFYPNVIRENFQINILDFGQFSYVILNSIALVGLFVFINRTLKIASASYTAMMASVTPILVAILGRIFLQENLSSIQFLGAILIISASFVTFILKVDKH